MRELSLNILDIVENSVKAEATLVRLDVVFSGDILTITVTDDGKGMTEEMIAKVTDPYTTTRTTRKVGMGLPLLKMAAEMTGGGIAIESAVGKGTSVRATFYYKHIDCMPLGDLQSTVITLITMGGVDYLLHYGVEDRAFDFDTREVKTELDGISIQEPEVLQFLGQLLTDNINNTNGGFFK